MNNKKRVSKITFAFLLAGSLLTESALAARNGKKKGCSASVARPSVYFVPHIRDYCPSLTPCSSFIKEVKDKGSGTLYGSKVLNYLGKEVDIGDCDTAIGKRGTCLKPFISVAADEDYFRMGDIIQVPAMKGKVIDLPNGKKLVHPGYFIVEDIGSGIQGPNRFDFFTGGFSATDSRNAFGYGADLSMSDPKSCDPENKFKTIRRGKSAAYNTGLAAIEKSFEDLSAGRMVASGDGQSDFRGLR